MSSNTTNNINLFKQRYRFRNQPKFTKKVELIVFNLFKFLSEYLQLDHIIVLFNIHIVLTLC